MNAREDGTGCTPGAATLAQSGFVSFRNLGRRCFSHESTNVPPTSQKRVFPLLESPANSVKTPGYGPEIEDHASPFRRRLSHDLPGEDEISTGARGALALL